MSVAVALSFVDFKAGHHARLMAEPKAREMTTRMWPYFTFFILCLLD
jgi:hypothetical protein